MRKADVIYALGLIALLATALFWDNIVPERIKSEIQAAKAIINE